VICGCGSGPVLDDSSVLGLAAGYRAGFGQESVIRRVETTREAQNEPERTRGAVSRRCCDGTLRVCDSDGHPPAGRRGDGQRTAGAGTGRRHQARKEREGESASGPATGAPSGRRSHRERAGHHDHPGPARQRHHRAVRSAVRYAGARWRRSPMGAVRADLRRRRRAPHGARMRRTCSYGACDVPAPLGTRHAICAPRRCSSAASRPAAAGAPIRLCAGERFKRSAARRAIRPARTTAELIAAVQKPLAEPSAFIGSNPPEYVARWNSPMGVFAGQTETEANLCHAALR
jgi:hypothetical protein